MSAFFLDALHLVPSTRRHHVEKTRPLSLQINLKPQPSRESIARTPKTPCSMLSPLTPKSKRLEWDGSTSSPYGTHNTSADSDLVDYEDDPSLALMMIDITSNLGKRLSSMLSVLVKPQVCTITAQYDKFCNRGCPPVDPHVRKLRNLEGRSLPAYRKRLCHRFLDRVYLFKATDKKERQKTLLSGGLNKVSRRLRRQMKCCTVVLERLNLKQINFHGTHNVDQILQLLFNPVEPVVMLKRLSMQQFKKYKKPETLRKADEIKRKVPQKINSSGEVTEKRKAQVIVLLTPTNVEKSDNKYSSHHRKSVRRRNMPRRLLHVI